MEKPGPNATSAEIAAWLEEDFWDGIADELEASDENDECEEC